MMMDVDTDVPMPAKEGKQKEVKGQLVRKLTPADDMRMQPGETACTHCLRMGRKCDATPGAACLSCQKSKVSCPL